MEKPEIVRCNQCKKDVRYHYEPINHLNQFVLTLVTLGLWIPMWLWVTFSPTKLCNECNGPIWDHM